MYGLNVEKDEYTIVTKMPCFVNFPLSPGFTFNIVLNDCIMLSYCQKQLVIEKMIVVFIV